MHPFTNHSSTFTFFKSFFTHDNAERDTDSADDEVDEDKLRSKITALQF